MRIVTKRIYDHPADDDGYRVLVDRLWPRGVSKEKADLDLWDKDVAPSSELREWWNHDPETYLEFERRYEAELDDSGAAMSLLDKVSGQELVTLLFAAHDPENNATVLAAYLTRLDS
ncbi:hypothetical protein BW730_05950 [Tessaracoccus aquimaris]|uniref:MarR family transcriptional regulator n=1 Tax=Tessaracoccus aquimaris TaxID=1332264 RepID=A0A1Q2CLZ5_9ACTN|nr:DUF488 family protein [Tessaracoccus aquimaris]AQP47127.1 hypothetical protein BW730_05950 [Tessaracoccus aquimaris]